MQTVFLKIVGIQTPYSLFSYAAVSYWGTQCDFSSVVMICDLRGVAGIDKPLLGISRTHAAAVAPHRLPPLVCVVDHKPTTFPRISPHPSPTLCYPTLYFSNFPTLFMSHFNSPLDTLLVVSLTKTRMGSSHTSVKGFSIEVFCVFSANYFF